MSNAPIGVFDSGVGGLTVLRALATELPREHFIYLGDTARLPYGTKSASTITRYAMQAAQALLRHGVKLLVIACNTASAVGLAAIRTHLHGVRAIGVIEPGAEAACRATRSGNIAVIATESTARGGAYQAAILRRRPDARVRVQAAQLFVALAEEGLFDGRIAEDVARHYLAPLFTDGPAAALSDTLVLGCTHFPMLRQAIGRAVGNNISIVDSAQTTARAARLALESDKLAAAKGSGSLRFLATDGPDRFARVGSIFLGRVIEPESVELIDF